MDDDNNPGLAEAPAGARRRFTFPPFLRALNNPNYFIFMSGQALSLVGAWIQNNAQQWLVYSTLKTNPFLLGLVGFVSQVPILLFGVYAGILADRVDRLRVIKVTQALAMTQAVALAALTLMRHPDGTPLVQYWQVLTLATLAGVVQAFDMPMRQAFLSQMVPKSDLGNAVALNSLAFNSARVIGPSLAGLLIILFARLRPGQPGFGEGVCFALNAMSFLAVLVSLQRIRVPQDGREGRPAARGGYFGDAFGYVRSHIHIAVILLFVGVVAVFGLPYLILIPVFAKDVFGGDARVNGALMSSVGIGAMTGGFLMARRSSIPGTGRLVARMTVAFSVMIALFAWARDVRVGCVLLVGAGLTMVMAMIGAMTVVQTLVADEYRGRVMSFYSIMNVGLMPFGSLLSGAEAQVLGPRVALTISASVCLVTGGVLILLMPSISKAARSTSEYRQAVPDA